MTLSRLAPGIRFKVIAGGAAGDHTVTGIKVIDRLNAVFHLDFATTAEVFTELTSEFTISAADTINNTGGTSSAGGFLFIIYDEADPLGGDLNRS